METRAERWWAADGVWARLVALALGCWLVVSPFLWRHGSSPAFNVFGAGILVATCAALAIWAPVFRFGTTFAAAFLFVTAIEMRHLSLATWVTSLVVSLALLALSMVPSAPRHVWTRRTTSY